MPARLQTGAKVSAGDEKRVRNNSMASKWRDLKLEILQQVL
jgi:hypothetical protein